MLLRSDIIPTIPSSLLLLQAWSSKHVGSLLSKCSGRLLTENDDGSAFRRLRSTGQASSMTGFQIKEKCHTQKSARTALI